MGSETAADATVSEVMEFLSMLLGLLLFATAFTGNKMEPGGCVAPAAHHISGNRPALVTM